jgi:hypothetical protein
MSIYKHLRVHQFLEGAVNSGMVDMKAWMLAEQEDVNLMTT